MRIYTSKSGVFKLATRLNWFAISLLTFMINLSGLSQPAFAEMKQITHTLNSHHDQTFSELMQEAQSQARSFIEQAFAENSAVTAVTVKINGERNGQESPLLFSTVSRADWQR